MAASKGLKSMPVLRHLAVAVVAVVAAEYAAALVVVGLPRDFGDASNPHPRHSYCHQPLKKVPIRLQLQLQVTRKHYYRFLVSTILVIEQSVGHRSSHYWQYRQVVLVLVLVAAVVPVPIRARPMPPLGLVPEVALDVAPVVVERPLLVVAPVVVPLHLLQPVAEPPDDVPVH